MNLWLLRWAIATEKEHLGNPREILALEQSHNFPKFEPILRPPAWNEEEEEEEEGKERQSQSCSVFVGQFSSQ